MDITAIRKNIMAGIVGCLCDDSVSHIFCVRSRREDDWMTEWIDSIVVELRKREIEVTEGYIEDDGLRIDERYDRVFVPCIFELASEPENVLKMAINLVSESGKLIVAANNRLGIRYFCGDNDPYTDRCFDGLDGYIKISKMDKKFVSGRAYSRYEIKNYLEKAGVRYSKFYSVFPNIIYPATILAEDYEPTDMRKMGFEPLYRNRGSVFLYERQMMETLLKEGSIHAFANAYFIECPKNGGFADVSRIELDTYCDKSQQEIRIFGYSDKQTGEVKVCEKAASSEGREFAPGISRIQEILDKSGISILYGDVTDKGFAVNINESELAYVYLSSLAETDKEMFLKELDRFMDIVSHLSDTTNEKLDEHVAKILKRHNVPEDRIGAVLKDVVLDLTPDKCIYKNREYYFFGQRHVIHNCPVKVLIRRVIDVIYNNLENRSDALEIADIYSRYDLLDDIDVWGEIYGNRMSQLRNDAEVHLWREPLIASEGMINSNRKTMAFPIQEYLRIFVDLFKNIGSRKLVLFGSGLYAKQFLQRYGRRHPVDMIIDNNPKSQGKDLDGIPIASADELTNMSPNDYKLIICVKQFENILRQIKKLGVTNYSVFDPDSDLQSEPEPEMNVRTNEDGSQPEKKKYHIGYVAGVFDLFHKGHLNLLKRAKEQCDYLIAGVCTDEWVSANKKSGTFIPFEERLEIVDSCKYVDKAVEVPLYDSGIREAWRLYHFDVQFSGNDHDDSPSWIADKQFLEERGADIVFFPYTESTSSTKLKALINKKLES